jgi:hypothetical protein
MEQKAVLYAIRNKSTKKLVSRLRNSTYSWERELNYGPIPQTWRSFDFADAAKYAAGTISGAGYGAFEVVEISLSVVGLAKQPEKKAVTSTPYKAETRKSYPC